MKSYTALVASLTLASGAAVAGYQDDYQTDSADDGYTSMDQDQSAEGTASGSGQYGEQGVSGSEDPTTQYETGSEDSTTQYETGSQDSTAQHGTDMNNPAAMQGEELVGKTVLTADGEELGEVESVEYSDTHQAEVALIQVGGFLGINEKLIAIPVTDLLLSADGTASTTLTRTMIETQPEYQSENDEFEE